MHDGHYIFGYGSLVNRDTHGYATAHRARLKGWRRVWQHTTLREVAFLSVVTDPSCEIDGLILGVPRHAPDLDKREYAYARTQVTPHVSHDAVQVDEVNLFTIEQSALSTPGARACILLSYLDTVVSGYCAEFGPEGVEAFFDTTAGWDVAIISDRSAPRYPRHAVTDVQITNMVDDALRKLPCTMTGV